MPLSLRGGRASDRHFIEVGTPDVRSHSTTARRHAGTLVSAPGLVRTDGAPATVASTLRLFDVAPEMERAVPPDDRQLARRVLVAHAVAARTGPLEPMVTHPVTGAPGLAIVLEGLVLRNTHLGARVVTEILGAGDVIDTRDDDVEPSLVPTRTDYVVHRTATLAFLGERFAAGARRWPGLYDALHAQLARQRRRASTHLAILQLPRVEDRVTRLFSQFADRWGRVTPEGLVVDLPLTHELIGQIIGGRRPTVSLALAELAGAGVLARRDDGSWLLARTAAAAG
jgi:CRP-like cAMP-binding protein